MDATGTPPRPRGKPTNTEPAPPANDPRGDSRLGSTTAGWRGSRGPAARRERSDRRAAPGGGGRATARERSERCEDPTATPRTHGHCSNGAWGYGKVGSWEESGSRPSGSCACFSSLSENVHIRARMVRYSP